MGSAVVGKAHRREIRARESSYAFAILLRLCAHGIQSVPFYIFMVVAAVMMTTSPMMAMMMYLLPDAIWLLLGDATVVWCHRIAIDMADG